jgi:hypothetical protein
MTPNPEPTAPPRPVSQVKRRILLAVVITALVGAALILGVVLMPPGVVSSLVTGVPNDTSTLRGRELEFIDALNAGRVGRIFRLFNSDFREEITEDQLADGIRLWLAGRKIRRIAVTHIEVAGLSGLVSSNVYFERSDTSRNARASSQDYLFQSWIRTPDGWQLLWLNKILDPVAQDYGRRDTGAIREVLQLSLDEIITGTGLERTLGVEVSGAPIVLLSHGASDRAVSLTGRKVLWLTRAEIADREQQLGIKFFIDVQPIRVLKHIAIGTFDIVPLSPGPDGRRRPRSIKLFLVRDSARGKWEFADYGSRW